MDPQSIRVDYNPNALPLDTTEKNLMIQLGVGVEGGTTTDPAFLKTSQSVLPVDIKLIPSKKSLKAKSVTVFEPPEGVFVAEGDASTKIDS
eukprot:47353-Ditylum_brightwellii.AAC.1